MPIDPRIPFLALGSGGQQQRSPLSSLAEVYQLRQQIESGQLAEEQRRLQQLEMLQRMQLAQQQAQREETKFGQQQRQYGIEQLAQRAVGSTQNLGAISEDEWAQIMESLGPETRNAATALRNKFRTDLAAAAKAEAEAAENLQKARTARLEAVSGLADSVYAQFGEDPSAFAGFVREASEAYPDEVRQFLALIPPGTQLSGPQIAAIYKSMGGAAPSRAPKVISPGQQIATQYGARYTAPPAKLGAFQLSGGPGTQAVQYNEQGQPVARLNVPQTASQAGTAKTGDVSELQQLPLNVQDLINKATSQVRGIERTRQWRKDILTGLQVDEQRGDAEQTEFKNWLRNAATQNLLAEPQKQVRQRSEMLHAASAMKKYLEALRTDQRIDTGILTGTVENVVRALGRTQDPELVSLGNQLQVLLQSYRHAITGAAFGNKEALEFQKQFPNWKNTETVNMALLDGLIKAHARQDWGFWSERFGKQGAEFLGLVDPDAAIMSQQGAPPAGSFRILRKK